MPRTHSDSYIHFGARPGYHYLLSLDIGEEVKNFCSLVWELIGVYEDIHFDVPDESTCKGNLKMANSTSLAEGESKDNE